MSITSSGAATGDHSLVNVGTALTVDRGGAPANGLDSAKDQAKLAGLKAKADEVCDKAEAARLYAAQKRDEYLRATEEADRLESLFARAGRRQPVKPFHAVSAFQG